MKSNNNILVHSETYKKRSIFNIIHQKRLAAIIESVEKLSIPLKGKLGDFGCSDGYIPNLLSQTENFKNWEMYGFEHSKEILETR